MKFDKGRRQIVVFLVVYLLISAMVFLTSFPYLSFKTLSETAELRLYSLFSIVAASFVFFYTKRMFKHASSFEKTVVTQNDTERREEERREQERINAENRKRKAEAEKKELTEKVAEISSGLDGESPEKYFDQLLINMSKCLDIVQGVAYALRSTDSKYFMAGSYAYYTEQTDRTFEVGEGIPGQVAKDKKILFMDNVPEDYIRVVSGLGNGSPRYLMEVPLVFEDQTWAVLELASFDKKDFNYDYFLTLLNGALGELTSKKVKSL
ncbi:MAG: GAF domain-containing protein [Bacteroidales bacterium]|nr:GAF domain-containing protein [Bacteroidales bacterium]